MLKVTSVLEPVKMNVVQLGAKDIPNWLAVNGQTVEVVVSQ